METLGQFFRCRVDTWFATIAASSPSAKTDFFLFPSPSCAINFRIQIFLSYQLPDDLSSMFFSFLSFLSHQFYGTFQVQTNKSPDSVSK